MRGSRVHRAIVKTVPTDPPCMLFSAFTKKKKIPLGWGMVKYVGFGHQAKETFTSQSLVNQECFYLWAFSAMLLCTLSSWVKTSCFW